MARKTYPETPAEEAARINAASGDPEGITAEQVANNRKLDESLTASFGFGNSTSGPPINPFASLVAGVSTSIQRTQEAEAATLPGNFAEAKAQLDDKISKASGELGSGLNGLTGNVNAAFSQSTALANNALRGTAALGAAFGGGGATTGMGGFADAASSKFTSAVDSLRTVAGSTSNIAADISGTINKLTGGSLAGGLMKVAGQVSSAAGMLNNILSLKRAANLPKGAEAFSKDGEPIKLNVSVKNDWRVRIDCQWNIFNSPIFERLKTTGGVVWPYLPNITVATKAEYTSINTVHNNYTNYAYKGSSVDDIQISGEFSCETADDAAYWIAATTFFKTATKMFFGQGQLAGNPPIICILKGYGASVFNNVPIIIKSFSVDLKDDVNYVKCEAFGSTTWVPVLSTISVTVTPVYTRERMRKFSLQDYSRGSLAGEKGKVGYI
jgi:hypothetical protein